MSGVSPRFCQLLCAISCHCHVHAWHCRVNRVNPDTVGTVSNAESELDTDFESVTASLDRTPSLQHMLNNKFVRNDCPVCRTL
jgi:hypothetical protein